jgi:phage terminase large subunit GpA-like protein
LKSLERLAPEPPIPSAEWVEKYFRLPPENSDNPGEFDFYYAPHAYGIFAALDDPEITDVYCMKSAQICWTTIMSAFWLSVIDQRPGQIIGMFSAVEAAREYSIEKLKPYVEHCSRMTGKLDVSSTRKAGGSLLHKSFPGGFLKLIGSNSVRSAKSAPAPYVFVEEPDDASANIQGQGDSVTVLFERTKTFRRPKHVLGGTPTIKNFSRVADRMRMSDQSVLPITCHSCEEQHVLDFENVTWLDADEGSEEHSIYGKALPESAAYACPHCGEIWNDSRRRENIRDTVAAAMENGDKFCGWVATKPNITRIKGFQSLSELYSCLPGTSMRRLVEKHLEAEYYVSRGDETKRISFVNNQLGREYEYEDGRPEAEHFREKAAADPGSKHNEYFCPRGGLIVTVGIDVQHDRVAVAIRAWGRDDESWLLYWGEISATNTCVDIHDGVWNALDQVVFRSFEHETGSAIYATAISIDSSDGTTSDAVYNWVRTRQKQHKAQLVMAIKGSSSQQDPEVFTQPKSRSIDHKRPDKQTKADRRGVKIYTVGTNKAKDWIAAHMTLDPLNSVSGFYHYYNTEQMRWDYFDQMCGEAKIPHKTIRNRRVWMQKNGQAVEAWDCEVYALHAARAKKVHLLKANEWDAIERQLLQNDLFGAKAEPEEKATIKPISAIQARRPQQRKRNWATDI